MSMASAAPFSGLSRPAKTAPSPPVDDHVMSAVGTQGGRIASTGTTRRQALAWNPDTPATVGGASPLRRVTKRGGDRLVRGQVERVHDRRVQCGGEPDRRRVEGVIVDNVVSVLTHSGVDARERRLGRGEFAIGGAGRSVERGAQRLGIDPGIDHRNARHLRSGGGVEVDLVTSVDEPARQVGHEGLRPTTLRLADGRHERRDDRDPHRGITLKARSRGGLIPSTSYGTCVAPRRRTSATALG